MHTIRNVPIFLLFSLMKLLTRSVLSQEQQSWKNLASSLSWSVVMNRKQSFKRLLVPMASCWPTMAAVLRTFTPSFIMDS